MMIYYACGCVEKVTGIYTGIQFQCDKTDKPHHKYDLQTGDCERLQFRRGEKKFDDINWAIRKLERQ